MQKQTKIDNLSTELKIALDNRAFEIQLFWQRSNYFLVLMTALGVATFSIRDIVFSPIISIFSTFVSIFWFRTNLGSKFWQESWETEVVSLAKEQNIRSFTKSTKDIVVQVREALTEQENSERRSGIREWINGRVLKKYSVTYNMIMLSFWAIVLWCTVSVVFIYRLIDYYCDYGYGCLHCS